VEGICEYGNEPSGSIKFGGKIAVFCENHVKLIDTLHGQNEG
jgi:hypothetical protein